MKKYILDFICKLEGYKTGIKQLHWDANSLSQHQLCDDIATTVSDYQDKVAEVEQSISGRLPLNNLKGTAYTVKNLKSFVEDVIKSTNDFYSNLKKEGDKYIGMRSDTEAFLSDMQRQLYLVDFTVKEGLKERLRNEINENRVTISNGKEKYSLTENELRELVSKAIHNVHLKEASDFSQFSNNEFLSFREKLSDLRNYASHMVEFADAKGDSRFVSYIGSLIRNLDGFINFIDERYK
jgi:DNA-binding ferritin-like protein